MCHDLLIGCVTNILESKLAKKLALEFYKILTIMYKTSLHQRFDDVSDSELINSQLVAR